MKPDAYTNAVLTVIAIMLTVIACKPLVSPGTTASAQSAPAKFSGIVPLGFTDFFDTRTGEIYVYRTRRGDGSPAPLSAKLRLTKLGEPLIDEYKEK